MNGGRRVVVVGAGIAGLGAAYTLRKLGVETVVFEATPHPGGRVTGEQVEGFYLDVGANVFLETYGTVRQVAEELDVPLQRTPVPINGGLYRNGKFHGFYGGDRFGNKLKTARTFLSFKLLSPKGLRQAFKFVRMLKSRSDDLSFDDHSRMLDLDTGKSAAAFLETEIGAELLERFVQPNLSSYTLGYPEEVGAAYAMAAA
ncbi:MAG: FAD-dependent oxidoreductase [Gammaproteobacteria bacterium]|nr:FAD-dependent oxidoreductase [Gammaproteobacteria bacterium]MYD75151.1 FAD-dependent oxidoreductase [Gammaproteobacteria bacterium]MYJ52641.1 FAD-dependent oxidoreductase [Gammaproteobacteria bacterium]